MIKYKKQYGSGINKPLPSLNKFDVNSMKLDSFELQKPDLSTGGILPNSGILSQPRTLDAFTTKGSNNIPKSTGDLISTGTNIISSLIPKKDKSGLTQGLDTTYDVASDAVMAIPGIGTTIGGAMKIGGLASDALTSIGVGTDQMTTSDKILDSKFMKLSPIGLLNAIGAKKTKSMNIDTNVTSSSGYKGSISDINNAYNKSGKKYGLLSNRQRKNANKNIDTNIDTQSKIGDILETSSNQKDRLQSLDTSFSRKNIDNYNFNRPMFKNGGTMKVSDKSVIVDGELHARKHNIKLDDINITHKGVPVINSLKDGGSIQACEVEREELILRDDIKTELKRLYQIGDEQSMIEAGKLISNEIMENTIDKNNIIKNV